MFFEDTSLSQSSIQDLVLNSVDELSELFKVFNNPKRLEILARLFIEPAYFGELLHETKLQPSSLSNHLVSLSDNNMIEKLERGLYKITVDGADLLDLVSKYFIRIKLICDFKSKIGQL